MSSVGEKPAIPLFERAAVHGDRTAVVDDTGEYSYRALLEASARTASVLLAGVPDLAGARVAFLAPPGFEYVAVQWGIWRAGGIAVPFAVSHPEAELEYTVDDAGASIVVAHPQYADRLRSIAEACGLRFVLTTDLLDDRPFEHALPDVATDRAAMVLYTSGSTGRPKGVVTTHANIQAQVTTLVDAWGWTRDDRILNVLPLHHVHGIINAMTCAFWTGAVCELQQAFDPGRVWERLAAGPLTLYMAVPTTYKALIREWESSDAAKRAAMSRGASRLRLMVSGSDALMVDTFEKWKEITGHVLLERYGMTEIGMALSNPLKGERVPGHVGMPLPGVEIRLVDLDVDVETGRHHHGGEPPRGRPGEVQVRGPSVFREYWRRPDSTHEAFTDDGWFCSGDVASLEDGGYRIWGRASQDIIITGGENVSAKEVEQVLSAHPSIRACAVVGTPDAYWGSAVSAAIVVDDGRELTRESLRDWARDKLAPYKLPQVVRAVESLPMNAMGKVVKPEVRKLFDADS